MVLMLKIMLGGGDHLVGVIILIFLKNHLKICNSQLNMMVGRDLNVPTKKAQEAGGCASGTRYTGDTGNRANWTDLVRFSN